MGLEPTTFVTLLSAHRAIHLQHGGLRSEKLAGFYWNAAELLALCYCTCSLLKGCRFESKCSPFFHLDFSLGIAYGAKVGLKLRLVYKYFWSDGITSCSHKYLSLSHGLICIPDWPVNINYTVESGYKRHNGT